MDEATFLALTFDAALALAEHAAVDYQEAYASAAGQEVHVWYANKLVVRYGADQRPLSVQLCGTQARLEPLDAASPVRGPTWPAPPAVPLQNLIRAQDTCGKQCPDAPGLRGKPLAYRSC